MTLTLVRPTPAVSSTAPPRQRDPRIRWRVVAGVTAAVLLSRLVRLDLASFVMDEPLLLAAAREQHWSSWATVSPLKGNVGVPYGPTVVWLYGVVHQLFGDGVRTAIAVMVVLSTVAQVALAWALARLVKRSTTTFLILAGVMATSPYLWFWSRLAWDQSVLVLSIAVVAILASTRRITVGRACVIGALVGLAVGSHPIALPFAIAIVIVLILEARRPEPVGVPAIAFIVGTAALVLVPYALHIAAHPSAPGGSSPSFGGLAEKLGQPAVLLTDVRTEYFFDGGWSRFTQLRPEVLALIAIAAVLFLALLVLAAAGIVGQVGSNDPVRRRLARIAAITWIGCVLMQAMSGVDVEPHYAWSMLWVVPTGVVFAVEDPRWRWQPRRPAFVGVAAGALMVTNLAFILCWVTAIDGDSGTRGPHYGVTLAAQEAVVPALCGLPHGTEVLNETEVRPVSLQYLMSQVDGCDWSAIEWCPAACDEGSRPSVARRLRYQADGSARLALERA